MPRAASWVWSTSSDAVTQGRHLALECDDSSPHNPGDVNPLSIHRFVPRRFRSRIVPQGTRDLPVDTLQASAKSTTSHAFVGHRSPVLNVSTPKPIRFFGHDRFDFINDFLTRALTTLPIDLVPEPVHYNTAKSMSTPNLTTDTSHVAPGTTNTDG